MEKKENEKSENIFEPLDFYPAEEGKKLKKKFNSFKILSIIIHAISLLLIIVLVIFLIKSNHQNNEIIDDLKQTNNQLDKSRKDIEKFQDLYKLLNEGIQFPKDDTKRELEDFIKRYPNFFEILTQLQNKFAEEKKYIKILFNESSIIEKEEEEKMLIDAMEIRINKKIKKVNKLYQATKDGDELENFHRLCDNKPNTLILIKSLCNRRFGGFTTQVWDKSGEEKYDQNAFTFSLDKLKIYPKNEKYCAIVCNSAWGPVFGKAFDFKIGDKCLNSKSSYTYESSYYASYDYFGDRNGLSEDGYSNFVVITDYEVFQLDFD